MFGALQRRSEFTFMHSSVGRGDDMSLLFLCHLLLFQMTCIGPCPFLVLAGVLKGGKTQKVGSWRLARALKVNARSLQRA